MTEKVNQVIDGLNHAQRGESIQEEVDLIRDLQNDGPTSFAFHRQQINDAVNFTALGFEDVQLHSVTADNKVVTLNQAGDRWQLRSGVSFDVLQEMPVGSKNTINPGDANGTYVRRPDGNVEYTVKAGDRLWDITKDVMTKSNNGRVPTDVDIDQNYRRIAQANGLANPNKLSIGQRLTIPPVGPDGTISQQVTPAFQPTHTGFDSFPPIKSDTYPANNAWGRLTTLSPGLMPPGKGVFSPLAPMGMMGSDPAYIYDTDKVGEEHTGGATRSLYTGWLRDSTFGLNDNNTKFDYADVTDSSGRLLSRHIEYSNPILAYKDTGASIKFDRGFGTPITLGVRSVDINLDSTGNYNSIIHTDNGLTYHSVVDSTGRVLRFSRR